MTNLNTIRSQALQLSPPEREELAQQLLESLTGMSDDSSILVDPEFEEEMHRRINSLADGTAKFTSGENFLAQLQEIRTRTQAREFPIAWGAAYRHQPEAQAKESAANVW